MEILEEMSLPQEEVAPTPPEETSREQEPLADPMPEPGEEELPSPDYEAMEREDVAELHRLFPHLEGIQTLNDLPDAHRFATLREAGLTVEEAFWATSHKMAQHPPYDNRSHLLSGVPRRASGNPITMTPEELGAAKDLFGDLTEAEIRRLWAKCRQ